MSLEMTTPEEQPTQPIETKTNRHIPRRILHLARVAITPVVGVGLVSGGAFLGYEFASIGAEEQSLGQVADTIGKYLGAIVGGAFGAMATVEVAPFIAGD